ncbi:MAG TPA: TolC family protein, partial [Burkholderiaceae bacterium]
MNICKSPIAAAAVLMAGCAVGPNFTRPGANVPQTWCAAECQTRNVGPSQATADPINTKWWTSFNDPELVTLEERVAGANLDLKVASLRLAESRAMRTVTAAERYPTLDGNAGVSRQLPSANGILGIAGEIQQAPNSATAANGTGTGVTPIPTQGKGSSISAFNLFQAGFDSSWELDLWGRVRREVEAADASVQTQAEARRDLLTATMAEVARDYIQLRGIQTDYAITLDNLNAARDIERVTRERHANGLASELDVAEAASQVATESALLPQLEQQESETINRLSFLLGQAPGALRSELKKAKLVPPTPPTVPTGLPSDLARRRPDIREAEASLHQATAQIGVAQAD